MIEITVCILPMHYVEFCPYDCNVTLMKLYRIYEKMSNLVINFDLRIMAGMLKLFLYKTEIKKIRKLFYEK